MRRSLAIHPPQMQTINDTLPIELFFQIFHHLDIADGPLGLRGALFVCRLWNNIILNDSHLWTNLVLNRTFIQHLVPSPAKLLSYIERCGALSGDHFIRIAVDTSAIHDHIYLDGLRVQQPDPQRVNSTSFSLLTIARAMARAGSFRGRVRTLVLSGGNPPSSALRLTVNMMIALVNESLKHLELHMYTDNAIESIARIPNSIETVFLFEPNWDSFGYISNRPVAARQLTFQRVRAWRGEDLTHIHTYQSLTELRHIWSPSSVGEPSSFEVEAFHNVNDEHTRHSIILPSVTTLYTRGAIPFHILDPLNLPALNTIEVRNHDFRQPLSTIQSTTLHHVITKLAVQFAPATADGWSDALAAILAGASQLRTLVASRWMERQLSVSKSFEIELV